MVRGDLGYSVLRAHPVHTSELEKTMARLKIATTENQRLRTQLEKIQKENSTIHSKQQKAVVENREVIAKQQRWLMGTVRRMKWVIKEKKGMEKALSARSSYVGKLETKLLKQTALIRNLKREVQRHRNGAAPKGGRAARTAKKPNARTKKIERKQSDEDLARSVSKDVRRVRNSNLVDDLVRSPRRASVTIHDQIDSIKKSTLEENDSELVGRISGILDSASSQDFEAIMSQELSKEDIEAIDESTTRGLQQQFLSMYESEGGNSQGAKE